MTVTGWAAISIYCILQILYLILANARLKQNRSRPAEHFRNLLLCVLVVFIMDMMARHFETGAGTAVQSQLTLLMEFFLFPLIPILYFLYLRTHYTAAQKRSSQYWLTVMLAMTLVYEILTVAGFKYSTLMYYDAEGIYHRGSWYFLYVLILTAMAVGTEVITVRISRGMEQSYANEMRMIEGPALVGAVLQIVNSDLPMALAGITFSLVLAFISLQRHSGTQDELTGVHSRTGLDNYLDEMTAKADEKGTGFSAILVNIDHFRAMNDEWGHGAGDQALIDTAVILRQSLRADDYIGRWGGDEFCAIMDTADLLQVQKIGNRVLKNAENFGHRSSRSYHLSFSIGWAVYDPQTDDTAEDFIRRLNANLNEFRKRYHRDGSAETEDHQGRRETDFQDSK